MIYRIFKILINTIVFVSILFALFCIGALLYFSIALFKDGGVYGILIYVALAIVIFLMLFLMK